jgi:AcrR family transcriptional regulator
MAYRKTEAVKAHLAAQRETIIAAAMATVAKHGKEQATITRVVERAGISMGLLYRYFPDIDEVWNAVVSAALARNVEAIREAVATAQCERYPLNALGRAIAVFYGTLDKPRLAKALADSPAYRKAIRSELEPILARLGFPPRARRDHAAAILGGLYGLSDVEASAKTAVTFAIRAIGVPNDGAAAIAFAASREVSA